MIRIVTDKTVVSTSSLLDFIYEVDKDFVPSLRGRVNIEEWVVKLKDYAQLAVAYNDDKIVGLLAYYANDFQTHIAYAVYLGVSASCRKMGIATQLLQCVFESSAKAGMQVLQLHTNSLKAKSLYEKVGFKKIGSRFIPEWNLVYYHFEYKL